MEDESKKFSSRLIFIVNYYFFLRWMLVWIFAGFCQENSFLRLSIQVYTYEQFACSDIKFINETSPKGDSFHCNFIKKKQIAQLIGIQPNHTEKI